MKKRFSLVCVGTLLCMSLLLTGCGEGKGAEDTGEDGLVGDRSKSTTSTTSTTPNTAATTDSGMMDDARDLVEDIMPGSDGSRKQP